MTTQPHRVDGVDLPADAPTPAPPNRPSHTDAREPGTRCAAVVDGTALRDLLVDLVNTNAAAGLRAHPVTTPLSRDRHAIDITDADGIVWRVDVHDRPHSQLEVA